MNVNSDPGAALLLKTGLAQQQASLGIIKRQAQQDAAVVTIATQTASAPAGSGRGGSVDIRA